MCGRGGKREGSKEKKRRYKTSVTRREGRLRRWWRESTSGPFRSGCFLEEAVLSQRLRERREGRRQSLTLVKDDCRHSTF